MEAAISTPFVTVCVSTRNRAQYLPRLVAHLEAQTLDPTQFEVVIVDNGSSDDTWLTLLDLAERTPLDLRPLQNPPGKGPAAGRNRAWRAARAPICAFTDDDCTPTPGWLTHAVSAMQQRVTVAAGRVSPPATDVPLRGPFSRVVAAGAETAAWGATANLIARRADLERVDGFDEDAFVRVAGEDTDLMWRIIDTGVEFTYLHDAVVEHPMEHVGLRGLLHDHQRWVDVPLVFARIPAARKALLTHRVFWKPNHERVLLLLAGVALASRRTSALLLTVPWLHRQLCSEPHNIDLTERVAHLPALLLLDCSEVSVMLRGSVRHRTLVL